MFLLLGPTRPNVPPMFRFLTAGESHGPGLVTVVEGLPAGLEVSAEELGAELARRRLGFGRGPRMRLEKDAIEIMAGVRFGRTLASPVAVIVRNTEWDRWQDEMAIEPGSAHRPMTTPRPGHADLAGMVKYDTHDARDILERASARETAARTVVGYLAKSLLAAVDVAVVSHVVSIGGVAVPFGTTPRPADQETVDESPVRAFDGEAANAMVRAIEAAKANRDTLGGLVEVLAYGVPPGSAAMCTMIGVWTQHSPERSCRSRASRGWRSATDSRSPLGRVLKLTMRSTTPTPVSIGEPTGQGVSKVGCRSGQPFEFAPR